MLRSERSTKGVDGVRAIPKDVSQYDVFIQRLRTRLETISTHQDMVAETRERLLVEREKGVLNRRHLRDQRIRVGNTEIKLIDALRRYFKLLARPLPNDLLEAYEKVEEQNAELRRLEEEQFQVEEDLGASEWRFVQVEANFYQHDISEKLLGEPGGLWEQDANKSEETSYTKQVESSLVPKIMILPTDRIEFQVTVEKHTRLMSRFEALRKQQVIRMEVFTQPGDNSHDLTESSQATLEATQLADDLLDLITECEVKLQQLRPQLGPYETAILENNRTVSEAGYDRKIENTDFHLPARAQSEGGVTESEALIPVHERVGNWSLQLLKSSAMEKFQYLNRLRPQLKSHSKRALGFQDWDPDVTQLWLSDHDQGLSRPSKGPTIYSPKSNQLVGTGSIDSSTERHSKAPSPTTGPGLLREENDALPYVMRLATPEQAALLPYPSKVESLSHRAHQSFLDNEHDPEAEPFMSSCRSGDLSRVPLMALEENPQYELPLESILTTGRASPELSSSIGQNSAQAMHAELSASQGLLHEDVVAPQKETSEASKGVDLSLIPTVFKIAIHKTEILTRVLRWPGTRRETGLSNVADIEARHHSRMRRITRSGLRGFGAQRAKGSST
jgi:hypothetical protein